MVFSKCQKSVISDNNSTENRSQKIFQTGPADLFNSYRHKPPQQYITVRTKINMLRQLCWTYPFSHYNMIWLRKHRQLLMKDIYGSLENTTTIKLRPFNCKQLQLYLTITLFPVDGMECKFLFFKRYINKVLCVFTK